MIRVIVACDSKRGIAKQGKLPWDIPEDRAYFTEKTKLFGGIVLMGSATFRTMRAPLISRTNYVLTSHEQPITGVQIVHDLGPFISSMRGEDVWIVGGASVFEQCMAQDLVDEIYVTEIDGDFECNQFFPAYDAYELVSQSGTRMQNGFTFTYKIYKKPA